MNKNIFLLLACSVLAGCASVTSGTEQNVAVNTNVQGAVCVLSNDRGSWQINSTPGSTIVHRSYGDLNVACQKGNLHGTKTVKSSTKGMAFGNIIAGGIIGAGVDCYNGSAYDYPSQIDVLVN